MSTARAALARLAAWPAAPDLAIAGAATLVAALLRLVRLGDVPYGVHPDEAGITLDAVRITHQGWIGVYSHAALGIPTLNSYLMAPGIAAFGRTAFAMRLDLAIVGLAAVPLLYALVRVTCGRAEAAFASLLLAVSYWHLFYSRIAHMSISYPTLLLAALLCIALGERRPGRARLALFAAAGALLGLSVYAYNVGAIAPIAAAVYLAVLTLLRYRRREGWRGWWPALAACFAAALLVVLPFLWYISDPHAYFWEHISTYRDVGVTRSPEYRAVDLAGKARIIADQLRSFAATYLWRGQIDFVDASGVRRIFDPLTVALVAAGLVLAARRRGERMVQMAACCILVVPLPALLQQGSMMREPLGAAPFVMFVAALPLAALWRAALRARTAALAALLAAAALAPVAAIGGATLQDYFGTWRYSATTRYVYHQEITSASTFMRTLPADAYVLFYSDRHPLALETRRFLSPDTLGEDRSRQFSRADASITAPKWDGPLVYILLGDYLPLLADIERRYPGGTAHTARHDGQVDFYAYVIDGRSVRVR